MIYNGVDNIPLMFMEQQSFVRPSARKELPVLEICPFEDMQMLEVF